MSNSAIGPRYQIDIGRIQIRLRKFPHLFAFPHEAGHALAAWIAGAERIVIMDECCMVVDKIVRQMPDENLSPQAFVDALAPDSGRIKSAMRLLFGPFVNLLCSLSCLWPALWAARTAVESVAPSGALYVMLFAVTAALLVTHFLVFAINMLAPGSDGHRALALMLGKPDPLPAGAIGLGRVLAECERLVPGAPPRAVNLRLWESYQQMLKNPYPFWSDR